MSTALQLVLQLALEGDAAEDLRAAPAGAELEVERVVDAFARRGRPYRDCVISELAAAVRLYTVIGSPVTGL